MSPLSFVAFSQTFEPQRKFSDAATVLPLEKKVKEEAQEENVSFFGVVKSWRKMFSWFSEKHYLLGCWIQKKWKHTHCPRHTVPPFFPYVVCPLCVVYVKSNLIRLYHQSYYSPLMFKHKFCLCFEPPSISGYCIGLKKCLFSLLLLHTFLLSSAKKRMAMLCTYFLLSFLILVMILLLKTPPKILCVCAYY